jgi:eukaryotic-like serine/threonine-protein kinase
VRRLFLLASVLALAGCGSHSTPEVSPAKAPARAPSARAPANRWFTVAVTVVDGNTHHDVVRARVRTGGKTRLTDRDGVAHFAFRRAAPLVTTVSARGYETKQLRLPFQHRPASTVQLYRPALQWPMYGVDAQRTQNQADIHLRPPFHVIWSRDVGGLVEFPAVVSDGAAYVGNYHGRIESIDMSDGSLLWQHSTAHGEMASSPAIWGADLVVHGMDGHVRVLRRSDGRLVSHFTIGSPIESSPVIVGNVDYFGAWNGAVYALDLHTNRLLWTFRSGCKITSSPALVGRMLYVGDYCGRLLALYRGDGRERWSAGVNGRIYGTPAVAAGRIFVPSSDGDSMSAFSMRGRLVWQRWFGSFVYSSPAVWHGRIFFGTYGGSFYGLSASSGRTLWSVDAGGPISGAAAVVDGVAYAGSFSHRILGVDAATGRIVLRFPHGEYVPVSGDGSRLLLNGYSRIYAVVPS